MSNPTSVYLQFGSWTGYNSSSGLPFLHDRLNVSYSDSPYTKIKPVDVGVVDIERSPIHSFAEIQKYGPEFIHENSEIDEDFVVLRRQATYINPIKVDNKDGTYLFFMIPPYFQKNLKFIYKIPWASWNGGLNLSTCTLSVTAYGLPKGSSVSPYDSILIVDLRRLMLYMYDVFKAIQGKISYKRVTRLSDFDFYTGEIDDAKPFVFAPCWTEYGTGKKQGVPSLHLANNMSLLGQHFLLDGDFKVDTDPCRLQVKQVGFLKNFRILV